MEKGKVLAKLLNDAKQYAREHGVAPIEIERSAAAMVASFIVRDLPMSCERGVVISAFYNINVAPIVSDLVCQLNECVVIDSDNLVSLIRNLWEERYQIASGRYSGRVAKTLFKGNRIPAYWREAAIGNDVMEDYLEKLNDNPIAFEFKLTNASPTENGAVKVSLGVN